MPGTDAGCKLKAGDSGWEQSVTSAGSEPGTSAGSKPGMVGNVMECGKDAQETGKYVTDVFRENALKKKEKLLVEFEVVTEDTEDWKEESLLTRNR